MTSIYADLQPRVSSWRGMRTLRPPGGACKGICTRLPGARRFGSYKQGFRFCSTCAMAYQPTYRADGKSSPRCPCCNMLTRGGRNRVRLSAKRVARDEIYEAAHVLLKAEKHG